MNVKQLSKKLKKLKIPEDAYSILEDEPNALHCSAEVPKCHYLVKKEKWEVFFTEVGKNWRLALHRFDTEDEACRYFIPLIMSNFPERRLFPRMNVKKLSKKLEELKVPKRSYCLLGIGDDNESYCLVKAEKWEVFYSERGNKNGLEVFDTEAEACDYFVVWIMKVFSELTLKSQMKM